MERVKNLESNLKQNFKKSHFRMTILDTTTFRVYNITMSTEKYMHVFCNQLWSVMIHNTVFLIHRYHLIL